MAVTARFFLRGALATALYLYPSPRRFQLPERIFCRFRGTSITVVQFEQTQVEICYTESKFSKVISNVSRYLMFIEIQ